MSPKQVKVGVFIPNDTMILDAAAVDLLGIGSKEYTSVIPFLPKHISEIAPSLSFAYIAPGKTIPMTPDAKLLATHGLSHPDVQPGKLDILLVPGVAPDAEFEEEALTFLREHAEGATDILSICTGILICAAAGITEGKRACGPRGMQDELRKKYPGTKFVGEEYRWVQDGNIWTSGGVTNGIDLVAAYIRTGKHFPPAVAEVVCKLADVGDRPQVYTQGQTSFMLGFAWQLLKGWFTRAK